MDNEVKQQTMNKEFEYRGQKFNIQVELNTRVERRINGDRWDTITINCMVPYHYFDNYYKKTEVNDKFLEIAISDEEILAKKYIDEKLDPKKGKDERLLKLGFK